MNTVAIYCVLSMACILVQTMSAIGEESGGDSKSKVDWTDPWNMLPGGRTDDSALEEDWKALFMMGINQYSDFSGEGPKLLEKHPREFKDRLIQAASGKRGRDSFYGFGISSLRLLILTQPDDPEVRKLIIGLLGPDREFSLDPRIVIWCDLAMHGSLREGSTLRALIEKDLLKDAHIWGMFFSMLKSRIENGISTKEEVVDFLQWCWRATEGKGAQKRYAEMLKQMGSKPDSAAVGSGEGAGRTLPKRPLHRVDGQNETEYDDEHQGVVWWVCSTGAAILLLLVWVAVKRRLKW